MEKVICCGDCNAISKFADDAQYKMFGILMSPFSSLQNGANHYKICYKV